MSDRTPRDRDAGLGWHPVDGRDEKIVAIQAEARGAALAELRAKVEGLTGTSVLDGRGIGAIHEPTREAVLALLDPS